MINLKEYIIEIEGEKYIPLKIAETAVAEAYNDTKLDEAMNLIKNALRDVNQSVADAFKEDGND